MKPVQFDQATHTLAEDQPEYLPLPVHVGAEPDYELTSCWELEPHELETIARTGRIYVTQLTFGQLLQPQRVSVDPPA